MRDQSFIYAFKTDTSFVNIPLGMRKLVDDAFTEAFRGTNWNFAFKNDKKILIVYGDEQALETTQLIFDFLGLECEEID